MSLAKLLDNIFKDDLGAVKELLQADPSLVLRSTRSSKLYQGQIIHWIYAGDTPLHLATALHRVKMTKILLDAGANPNAIGNHRGSRPLHYAADSWPELGRVEEQNQTLTMKFLLDAGAKISAQDKNGATPLHRAVRTRGAGAVLLLFDNGADSTIRNKPGSTAFHLAVQNTGRGGDGSEAAISAQRKIIEIFLARNASPREKDGKGKTVIDCARSLWIREILNA